MNVEEKRIDLLEVAEVVLNQTGKQHVEDLVDAEEIEEAQLYLLGALDHCAVDQRITTSHAAELYKKIGLSVEEANTARQRYMSTPHTN